MTNIYSESDYENALKLKNKLLTIYFAILAVGVAACVVFFVLFLRLPYISTPELESKKTLYLVIDCVISGIVIVFSFIYLGIPYKRAKYYFKLMDDIKIGKKMINESTFLQNEQCVNEVGNVDFHIMAVLEWSDKTQEYMRRNVLVDKEKPMPDFKNGDIIKYVTYANVLLSYGLKSEEGIFDDFDNADILNKKQNEGAKNG